MTEEQNEWIVEKCGLGKSENTVSYLFDISSAADFEKVKVKISSWFAFLHPSKYPILAMMTVVFPLPGTESNKVWGLVVVTASSCCSFSFKLYCSIKLFIIAFI